MLARQSYPFLLSALFLFCSTFVQAQDFKMQSLFVLNFAKYIEWPPSVQAPEFKIAVLGDAQAFKSMQELINGKEVGNQRVNIYQIKSPAEATGYHLVFVPASQSGRLEETLRIIDKKATLVVSEKEGLAKKGSHINLVVLEGKMRFEINKEATESQQLKVASNLLKLGIVV